jgi:hypothetical protein
MPRHNSRHHSPHTLRTKSTIVLCLVTLISALGIFGCGKSGPSGIHIKSANTGEKELATKSGYTFAVTKTFTDITGKISTASAYYTYLANYDLDAGNFAMTMDKPLTADDQVRVVFNLIGEEGTNDKSPLKAGTYSAKADKFMKVESVGIVSRKGAADTKFWFDRSTLTGEVKLTSASADQIAGDINVSAGDNTIKGSFTAKVLKRK